MAPRARGAVTAWLAQERHDAVLIEGALLLVGEFVVNSVRHARITVNNHCGMIGGQFAIFRRRPRRSCLVSRVTESASRARSAVTRSRSPTS